MGRIKRVEVIPEGVIVMTEHWALRATGDAGQREFHRVRTRGWSSGLRSVPLLRVIARQRTMSGVGFRAKSWKLHERLGGVLDDPPTAPVAQGLVTHWTWVSLLGLLLVHGLEVALTSLVGIPLSPFSMAYHGFIAIWLVILLQTYWRLIRRVPEVRTAMGRGTAVMRSVALEELGEPQTVAALRTARSHPMAGAVALELMCVLAPFVFFAAALPLRDALVGSSWGAQHLTVLAVHWLALIPLTAVAGELQSAWAWLWRRGIGRGLSERVSSLHGLLQLEPTEDDLELVAEAVDEALWLEARSPA